MTPFEKAQQLLQSLVDYGDAKVSSGDWPGYSLPTIQYAQMGEPVVACELVTVAGSTVVPHAAYGPVDCNASQLGTFFVIIARDCANISDNDGITIPEVAEEVSALIDRDGQLLWDWAANLDDYLSKEWSVAWALVGATGVTTLQLVTGID